MNQIERIEGQNYELYLWSDAVHDINTSPIKNLLNLVTQQLDFDSTINAHYYHVERKWGVRFRFLERQGFEQILDGSQLVCANAIFIECLARYIGDRIKATISNEGNQTWIIFQDRERMVAGIHQGGSSVNLVLSEVTQEFNYHGRQIIEIEAWNPGNATIRGDDVEVGGMLLQGELLEWLEIGESCHFRFSPNTRQIDRIERLDELDGTRITFTTRPRTNRLASFERVRQMLANGQIEISTRRSGFLDQSINSLRRTSGSIIENPCRTESSPYLSAIDTIGDRTCKYNALSRMLRCAVNPCGPCEGCTSYEKL